MIRRQAIRQTTDSSAISLSGVRSASLTAHRFLSCAASGSSVAPPFLLLYNRRCLKRPTRAGKNSQKVVKLCENSEPAFEQVRRARFVRRRPYETQRVAPNVALLLIRARYYDPMTGEFTSRDPLEYVDGMSLYRAYFGISDTDPSGKARVRCRCYRNWYSVYDNPSVTTNCGGLATTCCESACDRAGYYSFTGEWRVVGARDEFSRDKQVHEAALDGIKCWWNCMGEIHVSIAGQACPAGGAASVLTFTHLEVPSVARGMHVADKTTIQSKIAQMLRSRGWNLRNGGLRGSVHQLLRRGAQETGRQTIRSGLKSGVAGALLVEAVFSVYCGFNCS